jgi:hypothetical protein
MSSLESKMLVTRGMAIGAARALVLAIDQRAMELPSEIVNKARELARLCDAYEQARKEHLSAQFQR